MEEMRNQLQASSDRALNAMQTGLAAMQKDLLDHIKSQADVLSEIRNRPPEIRYVESGGGCVVM